MTELSYKFKQNSVFFGEGNINLMAQYHVCSNSSNLDKKHSIQPKFNEKVFAKKKKRRNGFQLKQWTHTHPNTGGI